MADQELNLLIKLKDNATSQLKQIDKEVEQSAKSWKDNYGAIEAQARQAGFALTAFGAVVTGVFAGIVKSFVETSEELVTLSLQTGMSMDAIAGLGYAAEQSGSTLSGFASSVGYLNRTMGEVVAKSEGAGKAIYEIGLNAESLVNLKPEDRFLAIAGAINRIEDPARRVSAAMSIFGRSGAELLPMMSGDISGMMERFTELHGGTNAVAGEAFGDAVKDLVVSLKGIGDAIAPLIVEFIQPLVEQATEAAIAFRKWAMENPELVKNILAVVGALAAFAAIMGPVLLAVSAIGAGLAALFNPITLIIVIIGALIAIVALLAANWGDFTMRMGNAWQELVNKIQGAWEFLLTAMRPIAEQIKTVIEIVLTPLMAVIDAIKWIYGITMPALTSPGSGDIGVGSSFGAVSGNATLAAMTGFMGASLASESGPAFAAGGIVTRPTRALIGESGPEAVVPLNNNSVPFEMAITIQNTMDGEVINQNIMKRTGAAYYRRQRLGG